MVTKRHLSTVYTHIFTLSQTSVWWSTCKYVLKVLYEKVEFPFTHHIYSSLFRVLWIGQLRNIAVLWATQMECYAIWYFYTRDNLCLNIPFVADSDRQPKPMAWPQRQLRRMVFRMEFCLCVNDNIQHEPF